MGQLVDPGGAGWCPRQVAVMPTARRAPRGAAPEILSTCQPGRRAGFSGDGSAVSQTEAPRSSLRVQTVAHAFTPATLLRYAEALAQSLHNARAVELVGDVVVALGDGSEKAGLAKRAQDALRAALAYGGAGFTYERFGQNLGHAEGQNRLFQKNDSELLLLCNDDVVTGPLAVTELVQASSRARR